MANALGREIVGGDDVLIAAVWVNPGADDADAVFANNRDATQNALLLGQQDGPLEADVIAERDNIWNPFFRAR